MSRGFTAFDEAVKHAAENKTIQLPEGKYYAVAGGKTTRVFYSWKDAEESIKGTSACHERFSTEQEAKQFIEDWKDAYADTWRRAIRQALDNGWRPKDMELDIEPFLVRDNCNKENNELPKLEQLDIKEEPKQ
ncbi:hypothetical protein PHISCL_00709 [Aspergillus sclerotialis]|uniref:Ribonuclease H1 N-terminal domain-containing protein n=1 Tax=Aspergillus sclerotialis TaxID=2070753 RepID=A0A3A2ZV31_9EURO|nr:hypothetical protein PHISCL_00709 [Aspergillus sclerotialis]